jgi:hypothetical protein
MAKSPGVLIRFEFIWRNRFLKEKKFGIAQGRLPNGVEFHNQLYVSRLHRDPSIHAMKSRPLFATPLILHGGDRRSGMIPERCIES